MDHPEEVMGHPEEVLDHPEEVLDHPEEVLDHLEEVMDHPEEVMDHDDPKEVKEHPKNKEPIFETKPIMDQLLRAPTPPINALVLTEGRCPVFIHPCSNKFPAEFYIMPSKNLRMKKHIRERLEDMEKEDLRLAVPRYVMSLVLFSFL